MFTGIIKGLGTVVTVQDSDAFRVIKIDVGEFVSNPQLGASVSVSGVCLSITAANGSILSFDVMRETLEKTTLHNIEVGDVVNLETPLRVGDELGGHIVQGHIDGLAKVTAKDQTGENTCMQFELAPELAAFLVDKGSVAVDGISLTVCRPTHTSFEVWLLPQTLNLTTLGKKTVGDTVNIEVDYMMKAFLKRIQPTT